MDIVRTYHALIDWLIVTTGMTDKLLHVHAGLAIYVLAQLAIGTRRASFKALAVVVVAEAGNEIMDRLFSGGWHLDDTIPDVLATLVWPTILTASGLYRRARWRQRHEALRLCSRPFIPGPAAAVA